MFVIAPGVQENYSNQIFFQIVEVIMHEWFNNMIDDDSSIMLFRANMILELMFHVGNTPCSWCDIDKNNLLSRGKKEQLMEQKTEFAYEFFMA